MHKGFSELLKKAIEEADALFDYPGKQYALLKDLEEKVAERQTPGIPNELARKPHAKAYFGVFRLVMGDEEVDVQMDKAPTALIELALTIDETVNDVVAENTLNPGGIDAGIRKVLLPDLFKRFGLDKANRMLDEIVHIVKVGLKSD